MVPDDGPSVPRPEPTKDLLREVQAYLDRRRVLTSHLMVIGPRYLPVRVVVAASAWNKAVSQGLITGAADVQTQISDRLKAFLHPTRGGAEGKGWAVGQSVFIADLFKAIQPSEEVGFISALTLAAETPAYHVPPLGPGGAFSPSERPFALSAPGPWVRVADYELICYGMSSTVTVVLV